MAIVLAHSMETLLETLLCTKGRPLEVIWRSVVREKSNGGFNMG